MDDAASPAVGVPACANRSGIRPLFSATRTSTSPDSAIVRAGYCLAPPKPASPHAGMTPHCVAAVSLMDRNGQE